MSLRLLHTSDWHLGQVSRGESREAEHREFLQWLAATVLQRQVDVLLVSGDVFHTRNPSAEALALYFNFLERLRADASGVRVIITGGNHDSAAMLNAPSELLSSLGVHVVGGYDRNTESDLIVPVGPAGSTGEPCAVVAAVPYVHEWFVCGNAENADTLAIGFHELYGRVADLAAERCPGLPLVGMGHLTIAPTRSADADSDVPADATVQELTPTEIHRVGYLGALPTSIFDERYRYVALGHIHRSYAPEKGRVAYSGSPIALNFTEPWNSRRCLLVDLEADGAVSMERLPIPCWRRMVTISGTMDEVLDQARKLEWDEQLPPLVRLRADIDQPDAQAWDRLASAFEHFAAPRPRILETEVTTRSADRETTNELLRSAQQRVTPESVFRLAWHAEYGDESPPDDVIALFSEFVSDGPELPGDTSTPGDNA